MTAPMLEVRNASKQFGGLRAVDGVSLSVQPGEIVSIIGPNGAGKTTLFNLLTGQLVPTEGEVRYLGEPINALPPHARARRGMGRTFQIAKPLMALNALENVMIGAFLHDAQLGPLAASPGRLRPAQQGRAPRAHGEQEQPLPHGAHRLVRRARGQE